MSSKPAPERRPMRRLRPRLPPDPAQVVRHWAGSIVVRLTAWYAGSALALILAATGFLYWALATNFAYEDQRALANTVTDLRLLLRASGELRLAAADPPVAKSPFRQPEEILVRILDHDGRVLLESPGMSEELPVGVFPPPETIRSGQDLPGQVDIGSGRVFQVLSARAADAAHPDGRVLQVAMDRAGEELLLEHYRERFWVVILISIVMCAATGYVIARRGIRPIERVSETARRVHSSTLYERIDTTDLPTELQALAGTFNEMLDRLEESFTQISQFSADVAHELRTPISNLRGELEVALGKPRSPAEYTDIIGSALEECVRISRVIQSLLFLARAETSTDGAHFDMIQVRHEIDAVLEFYDAAAAEAGVSLSVAAAEGLVAPFDRTLFQQAVGNLVANAIAHTPPGGHVTILPSAEGDRLRVEISDTGCGIAAEDMPYVFDRFYRADPARQGASGNLGLGLAMVRSIARLHGGEVGIESAPGVGTRVVLETPLAPASPLPHQSGIHAA